MRLKASPTGVFGDIYGFKTINRLRSNAHIVGVAHKGTGHKYTVPFLVRGFVLTTLHSGMVMECDLVSEM